MANRPAPEPQVFFVISYSPAPKRFLCADSSMSCQTRSHRHLCLLFPLSLLPTSPVIISPYKPFSQNYYFHSDSLCPTCSAKLAVENAEPRHLKTI